MILLENIKNISTTELYIDTNTNRSNFYIDKIKLYVIKNNYGIFVNIELFTVDNQKLMIILDIYLYDFILYIIKKQLTKRCLLRFIKRYPEMEWELISTSSDKYYSQHDTKIIRAEEFLL